VVGDQNYDQKLKVTEEIEKEFKFEGGSTSLQTDTEPISYMHYSRSFKKIMMSTELGLIGVLPVEAELVNLEEEEDQENQGEEKERKPILTPFVELGRFHT